MIRTLLTLLFCCCITTAFAEDRESVDRLVADVATAACSATTPTALDWDHWRRRHERFSATAATSQADVLLLGDSITENWLTTGAATWRQSIEPLGAINFGIAGDRTQGLLWRMERGGYEALHPKVVVILIGTNNLKDQRNTVNETVAGITKVANTAAATFDAAEILLLGLLPCRRPEDAQHGEDVVRVNQLLQELNATPRLRYVSLDAVFREADGSVRQELLPDGLHPSTIGYDGIATALVPVLRQMLSPNLSATSGP